MHGVRALLELFKDWLRPAPREASSAGQHSELTAIAHCMHVQTPNILAGFGSVFTFIFMTLENLRRSATTRILAIS
jgi:hypothetical protein